MSVKRPKLQCRPRRVKEEDCPNCGSLIGDTCRSYKGRGCAPHAIPLASQAPKPKFVPMPTMPGVQLLLFEVPPPLTQDETPA